MNKLAALIALTTGFAAPTWAATRTVTLAVPGMTCVACPITVKTALGKVEGVQEIRVRYEQREAIVTFDDARTSADALMRATTNAGYPSTLKP